MKAREQAWTFLCAICMEHTYSNLLLKNKLKDEDLRDRALITQIVYGTIQNYRYVRYMWSDLVKKIPDEKTALLLDMSVYQLECMDKMPAYAVLNDAVDIAKMHLGNHIGSLVNAVLRNVMKRGRKDIDGTKEEYLAIETSHPLWLVQMWKAQYGWDTTEKICRSNLEEKPQFARVNTLKMTKADVLQQDDAFEDVALGKDALLYKGGNIAATTFYQDGYVSIQDLASQMVVEYMNPQKGERILDVCAAPGTKTMHMAQRMENEGYILSGDIHQHRVELIKESADRLGIKIVEAKCMDATQLTMPATFDRVLCDVPCSGYGVLGRKCDIKYHMKSEDMDTLIPLQQEILRSSSKCLKDDGILVYSTCTLNKKENEKQIEHFVRDNPSYICEEMKTIFPFENETDGFFIARLKKQP